jgi:hypothetical protein
MPKLPQHLRRDPRVSVTALGEANWYRHVSLHCRVASLADDPELAEIDRLSQHCGAAATPAGCTSA